MLTLLLEKIYLTRYLLYAVAQLLWRLFCLYIAPLRTCGKVVLYQLSKNKTGKQARKAIKLEAEQKQNINKDTWKSPVCVTPEAQVPLTLESKFRMTPIKS